MPGGQKNKKNSQAEGQSNRSVSDSTEVVREPVSYNASKAPFFQLLTVTVIERLKTQYCQTRADNSESKDSLAYKQTVWDQLLETAQSTTESDKNDYYQHLTDHLKQVKQTNNEATEKDGCHVGELQGYCQAAIDLIDELKMLHNSNKLFNHLSNKLNMHDKEFQHLQKTNHFVDWLNISSDKMNEDMAQAAVCALLKDYWLEKKLNHCQRSNTVTVGDYIIESGRRAADKVVGDNGVKQAEKEKLMFKYINQLVFTHKTQSKEDIYDYGQSVKDVLLAMQVENKQIEYQHSSKMQLVHSCATNVVSWFNNNAQEGASKQSRSQLDCAIEPLLKVIENQLNEATNQLDMSAEDKPGATASA